MTARRSAGGMLCLARALGRIWGAVAPFGGLSWVATEELVSEAGLTSVAAERVSEAGLTSVAAERVSKAGLTLVASERVSEAACFFRSLRAPTWAWFKL